MGADYSFELISIVQWVPKFIGHNKIFLGSEYICRIVQIPKVEISFTSVVYLLFIYMSVRNMGALKSSNETRANLREMKDKMHFFPPLLCFALRARTTFSIALAPRAISIASCALSFISFKLDFLFLYSSGHNKHVHTAIYSLKNIPPTCVFLPKGPLNYVVSKSAIFDPLPQYCPPPS